jgi:pantoate--beta-alanine ligase
MKVIESAQEMLAFSTNALASDATIGFVPTMGALHTGHMSLVRRSMAENTFTVVSVFVNPTQFNDPKDLEKYPRTFERDRCMLEAENVSVAFHPSVSEIYPDSTKPLYDLGGLDLYMEGPNRPGHFNGVVQVVSRLFDLVKPTRAYFGEKDFQQLAIIRHTMPQLGHATVIIGCPTERETSGLAMSSRNELLSQEGKQTASAIFKILTRLKSATPNSTLSELRKLGEAEFEHAVGIELEYLEFVDPASLQPVRDTRGAVQVCVATRVEGVRLIDNMRLK